MSCQRFKKTFTDECIFGDQICSMMDRPISYFPLISICYLFIGFFTVEDTVYVTRLYRIHPPLQQAQASSIHLEPVPVLSESLDPR